MIKLILLGQDRLVTGAAPELLKTVHDDGMESVASNVVDFVSCLRKLPIMRDNYKKSTTRKNKMVTQQVLPGRNMMHPKKTVIKGGDS